MAITVPRQSLPRVEEQNYSNLKQSAAPSAAALGGGQPAAQAFGAVEDAFQKIKQNADQVAILDAQNQLAKWENQKLYDKDNGLMNRKGKEALSIADEMSADYDKTAGEIESGLSGLEQKVAFSRLRQDRYNDINRVVQRHTQNELEKYDDDQTQAGIALAGEDVARNFGDEELVIKGINKQSQMLFDFGKRKGWSQDQFDQKNGELVSKNQRSVIEQMLASDSAMADIAATSYFEKHKATLTEDDRAQVTKTLEKATLLAKATRNSDEIFAKNKGSQVKAFAALSKIENEKERAATRDLLKQSFGDLDTAQRQDEENTYKFLYNKLSDTGFDLNVLSKYAGAVDSLPPEKQEALKRFAQDERSGGGSKNRVSNDQVYYGLSEMLKTPEGYKEFSKMNLLDPKITNNLSTAHREFFLKAQREGYHGQEVKFGREAQRAMDLVYREAGLKLPTNKSSAKEVKRYNDYVEQVKAQATKAKDTSYETINKFSRDLVKKDVLNKVPFFMDVEQYRFEADPDRVDIDDIDPEVMKDLTESLQAKGRPATEENLRVLYIEALKAGRI